MPTPTTYQYTVSTLPVAGAVDLNRLTEEIQGSSIVTALDTDLTLVSNGMLSLTFKDVLSTADKTTLDGDAGAAALDPPTGGSILATHDGTPLEETETVEISNAIALSHKLTTDGRIRVASEKSDAESADLYSHNWADKTTWCSNSVRVVDEVATNDGDNKTYSVANEYIIDNYHGKMTGEDNLLDSSGNSYRVTVKVDDVVKTEVDPHTEQHPPEVGDFKVDYAAGKIIFQSALTGSEVIKVTYHYATNSHWTVGPDPGKKLIIEVAEVQFTDDIDLSDSTFFQTWGFVDVFAPQLLTTNGGPYPPGTQIPISTFKYKTMKDFQNAAFKSYPTVPAIGGLHWRGLTRPVLVFDWDYQRGLVLYSSYGMKTTVLLEHDIPYGGSWATATFYCGIDSES